MALSKTRTIKSVGEDGENLQPADPAGGDGGGTATVEMVWQFLRKLNRKSLYDPAVLLLGGHPRERKTRVHSEACTLMTAEWEQP